MAVHGWRRGPRGSGAVALRFAPATSRLDRGEGEITWSTSNLQQAARVADWTTLLLAEEAGAPARLVLVQYERTGKGLHHAKDSRTKADSTEGLG